MAETRDNPTDSKVVHMPGADVREKLLVVSLEVARRSLEAASLDELYFLLTNDIRVLIEFDRSFLITHMGGTSGLAVAGNQPMMEKKSKFQEELNRLAGKLSQLAKPLLLSNRTDVRTIPDEDLSPELKESLASYLEFSGCTAILCVPLKSNQEIVGHLIFEFLGSNLPDQPRILTILGLAPFLGAALAHRWVIHQYPVTGTLTRVVSWRDKPVLKHILPHVNIVAMAAAILIFVLFVMPFPYTVGGEAEIVPQDRHLAFCKVDGLIDHVNTTEGSTVQEGQTIATLDPTEIDYKIRTAQRQVELLGLEMAILKKSGGLDVAKLAESRLVELKRKSAQEELRFLQWQRQFLEIRAPASGVVLTKHVETLMGKKFKAGEPFAEIAEPGGLLAEIHVPEDRIAFVKVGQAADLYLNSHPFTDHPMKVSEIAPKAEAEARQGNIYRVRAAFFGSAPAVKVGMKAVGKINTGPTSLWSMMSQRLCSKWNQFTLYFW
jgi:multidrug resistance efflux pump